MEPLPPDDDAAWENWRNQWSFPAGVTYLNHGSFGPSPRPVCDARRRWQEELERQPFDFLVRQLDTHLAQARRQLAAFVGADPDDLVFVENATVGMNVVAASVTLHPGDDVLLTDQEYGAVRRIWQRACDRAGAKLVIQPLPQPIRSADEVTDTLLAAATPRTRLVVFSHVTSPTATILPAQLICRQARARNLTVCIDGPHALAVLPLHIARLDCDYYTVSCHKWLSAPIGSGFLYVNPRAQRTVQPAIISWGHSPLTTPTNWRDEFAWTGTRDPTALLAVPPAIDFLEQVGLESFRQRTHWLAQYARERITRVTGLEPLIPDSAEWYGSMIALPLPSNDTSLQQTLWGRYGIEVPIFEWSGQKLIRVSCHLYTTREHIDRLADALGQQRKPVS